MHYIRLTGRNILVYPIIEINGNWAMLNFSLHSMMLQAFSTLPLSPSSLLLYQNEKGIRYIARSRVKPICKLCSAVAVGNEENSAAHAYFVDRKTHASFKLNCVQFSARFFPLSGEALGGAVDFWSRK